MLKFHFSFWNHQQGISVIPRTTVSFKLVESYFAQSKLSGSDKWDNEKAKRTFFAVFALKALGTFTRVGIESICTTGVVLTGH
jgi:hypothetical protein